MTTRNETVRFDARNFGIAHMGHDLARGAVRAWANPLLSEADASAQVRRILGSAEWPAVNWCDRSAALDVLGRTGFRL